MSEREWAFFFTLFWALGVLVVLCVLAAAYHHIQSSRWQDGHPRLKIGTPIDPRYRNQRSRTNNKRHRWQ